MALGNLSVRPAKVGIMKHIRTYCLLVCVAVALSGAAPSYSAARPGDILLGFEARYGEADKRHLGIDVELVPDTTVYAPVDGTVSFVGRVPGSAGLNVTALTITTSEGQSVTLNPFSTTQVAKGDPVLKGEVLGVLASSGDPSSAQSHAHLSLRENDVYKDPSGLIVPMVGSSVTVEVEQNQLDSAQANAGQPEVTPTLNAPATAAVAQVVPKPQVHQTQPQINDPVSTVKEHKTSSAQTAEPASMLSITRTAVRTKPVPLDTGAVPMTAAGIHRVMSLPDDTVGVVGVRLNSAPAAAAVMSNRVQWYESLDTSVLAILLFIVGVVLTCAGTGVVVILDRAGVGPSRLVGRFAVRNGR